MPRRARFCPAGYPIHVIRRGNKPGMILQVLDRGYWRDYLVDGEQVVSPFDENKLPAGKYRLVNSGE